MNKKRDLIKLIGLISLLAAIPVTLFLMRQQQILKGRATGSPPMEFFTTNGASLETDSNGNPKTPDQNIQLRLTYGDNFNPGFSNPNPTATPTPNPTPGPNQPSFSDNQCLINLAEGQSISGNVSLVVSARKSDPTTYLSLYILNSKLGSFQAVSTQALVLFANLLTSNLFANGPANLECRLQTDPTGGTIISSTQVNINVQN